jgi:hypothetical protein
MIGINMKTKAEAALVDSVFMCGLLVLNKEQHKEQQVER